MVEPLGLRFRLLTRYLAFTYPTVPRISTDQVQALIRESERAKLSAKKTKPLILLDVREEQERIISCIKNSIHVPPSLTDLTKIVDIINEQVPQEDIPKTVIFYCAIGLRASIKAEKFLEMLKKPKYETLCKSMELYQMEGSIFKWGNEAKDMEDPEGHKTVFVHPIEPHLRAKLLWPQIQKYN